jgi:hypothetical protein
VLTITLALLALAAAPAAAWGPAVHAFVADHIGKADGANVFEMYGAMLPDACYFAFDPAVDQDACAAYVHDQYLRMWDEAYDPVTEALGFGYVSHNNDWGADRTAHARFWGYIVTRARFMAVLLRSNEILRDLPFEVRESIAHTVLEAATDVQVLRVDPDIGGKIMMAAESSLEYGFGEHFAAVYPELGDLAMPLEAGFQQAMFGYGFALSQGSEEAAIGALATMFAPYADTWVPGGLPDGVDAEELIVQLIELGIVLTANDFPPVLEATRKYVRSSLWWHGIRY